MSPKTLEAKRKLEEAQWRFRLPHQGGYLIAAPAWRHYKGGVYEILGFVICTEDGEVGVRYKRVAGPEYDEYGEHGIEYVRPLREWFEEVPEQLIGGDRATREIPRFEPVERSEEYVAIQGLGPRSEWTR